VKAQSQAPNSAKRVVSLAVDEELRDLEIDGYKVAFTTRVALMPVALTPVAPTGAKPEESNGHG
jgi:hypothetical protein